MASQFLTQNDKGAFLGMECKTPEPEYELTAVCPQCSGYGGWHLTLDAYGKGKHFDGSCSNCDGWGYVEPENAGHIHQFVGMDEQAANKLRAKKGLAPASYTYGNCCHNSICKICGQYHFIDSSD